MKRKTLPNSSDTAQADPSSDPQAGQDENNGPANIAVNAPDPVPVTVGGADDPVAGSWGDGLNEALLPELQLDEAFVDPAPVSKFVLEPMVAPADPNQEPVTDDGCHPAARRIADIALPKGSTERMVRSISEQLARILHDDFGFRVTVDTDEDNIQIQKLTMYINLLLENVRRSLRNLTDLAQEQEEIITERTRVLDLVISGSNDGVWIWNIAEMRAEFSSRWYDSLGLPPGSCPTLEEWVGLIHADDREQFQVNLRSHLQGLTPYLHERFRIRHGDGTYRWMWCRGRCLRDEAGRPLMMAGTLTDIHNQTSIDRWTGLPNDQALNAYVDSLLSSGQDVGLLLIGLPGFHRFLETLSPGTLDALRKVITRRMSALLPYHAFLARLPGEFYAVVIPAESRFPDVSREIGTRLLDAFSNPVELPSITVPLDLAIGASCSRQCQTRTSEAVLQQAWISYRAARRGSGPFNQLTDAQIEEASKTSRTKDMVRAALKQDRLVPHFQPVVDARTMKICGFEILCRLDDPQKGLLPPAEFIGVAQQIGVMPAITRTMLEKGLDKIADWERAGGNQAGLFVSVNIDARDLLASDFFPWVQDQLKQRRLAGRQLTLELRESTLVGALASTAEKVAQLRGLGIKIALDDFGTGYSSLTSLNQLDVDWIKIDRSFVADLRSDGRKRSMVRMIRVLADQIGAQVCVDGVEVDEQLVLLQELSVDLYQGFIFGKPMSADDASALMMRQEEERQTA